ncbi:hypothetical protein VCHENC02_1382B, partial [Vibrio harveyi]
ECKKKKS